MKYIYIITWCLRIQISCPPEPIKYDEFDRVVPVVPKNNIYVTIGPCYSYDCEHEKTFTDKKLAYGFYMRAKQEVHNVKIDSLTEEQYIMKNLPCIKYGYGH